jgi:hypothetical protein
MLPWAHTQKTKNKKESKEKTSPTPHPNIALGRNHNEIEKQGCRYQFLACHFLGLPFAIYFFFPFSPFFFFFFFFWLCDRYLPKGIVHFAVSGSHGSYHLTVSLSREGASWEWLVRASIERVLVGGDMAAAVAHDLSSFVQDVAGLDMYASMPMWLLREPSCLDKTGPCFRALYARFEAILRPFQAYVAMQAPQAQYTFSAVPAERARAIRGLQHRDVLLLGLAEALRRRDGSGTPVVAAPARERTRRCSG